MHFITIKCDVIAEVSLTFSNIFLTIHCDISIYNWLKHLSEWSKAETKTLTVTELSWKGEGEGDTGDR